MQKKSSSGVNVFSSGGWVFPLHFVKPDPRAHSRAHGFPGPVPPEATQAAPRRSAGFQLFLVGFWSNSLDSFWFISLDSFWSNSLDSFWVCSRSEIGWDFDQLLAGSWITFGSPVGKKLDDRSKSGVTGPFVIPTYLPSFDKIW